MTGGGLVRRAALMLAMIGSGTAWAAEADTATLTPQDVARLLAQEAITLVDVREAEEFAPEHLDGALFLPLSQITPARLAKLPTDKPIVFYCRSGRRSASVLAQAQQIGLPGVHHMQGGILAWKQTGLARLSAVPDNARPVCTLCS